MRKQRIGHIACMAAISCIMALLASCGTSRKATGEDTGSAVSFSAEKHMASVKANHSDAKALTSRVKVKLVLNGKDMSTSGTLRMKRGEAIQISLVDPILGIAEVGKLEFTKDKVLIVDRINRRYLEEPYSKVDFLSKANISFGTLEALFWNEVFQPGSEEAISDKFSFSREADNTVDIVYADKYLTYTFATDRLSGKLQSTSITTPLASKYALNMLYDDFREFEDKEFPHSETLQFVGANGSKAELLIRINAPTNNSDWSTGGKISSKYKKMDATTILDEFLNF